MTITSILEYDKRKVLIQLDGHLTFPLYKSEVDKLHLLEGEDISAEVYSQIMEKILPKRVKLRVMHLLQKRSYTREGLRRKLAEGKYPEDIIVEALDYVESYGYIDDERYAAEYIRCYCESRSKRRIMQDLFVKGISKDVAESAWMHHEALNEVVDEVAQIKELLRKKQFDAVGADRKETAKVMNYLYRKGYSTENIMYCVKCDEYYTSL